MDASKHKNERMDGWMQNTVHGLLNAVPVMELPAGQSLQTTGWAPTQANTMVGGAACRAVPATCAMILGHMVMEGHGANATRASRHGVKAEAGRQGMARPAQAVVAKTVRQV